MVLIRNRFKLFTFLCVTLSITNYLDLNALIRKTLLAADNETIDGYDDRVQDNCYIIQNEFNGINQWGNAVYFYMFSLMYLIRNGASIIVIKEVDGTNPRQAKPIGTMLDGVVFGPKADAYASYNEKNNNCLEWDPKLLYRQQGAMQDVMDLRRDWDTLTSNWPKNKNSSIDMNMNMDMNTNPFISNFGITPSLIDAATNAISIDWNDVLVLHIRQGDVMEIAYPPHSSFVHSQPPCSYYEDVIETGYANNTAFPYVLIITNPQEDEIRKNPCDQYLRDRYGNDNNNNDVDGHDDNLETLQTSKLLDYEKIINQLNADDSHDPVYNYLRYDLHILSQAINLAEGHSTFTMGTNMLNTNLKRHFVPANPSTINCVWPFHTTLNGDYVYTRQHYSKDLIQTQYLLPDWLGFNPTCDTTNLLQLRPWRQDVRKQAMLSWDGTNENITTKMLDYPRNKLLKYVTSNKPFSCSKSINPLIVTHPDKWFVPCVCEENEYDELHMLFSSSR